MSTAEDASGSTAASTAVSAVASAAAQAVPEVAEVPQAVARLERELGVPLRRSRAMVRASAQAVHPQLNFEAYSILVRLDDLGSARPSELAAFFRIGKPTLSRQVQLLEHLQLLQREADPADARAVQLSLTEAGREQVRTARAARRAALIEQLGVLRDPVTPT